MKRKMAMLLAGGVLMMTVSVTGVQAKTYGYDLGDGSSFYYFFGSEENCETEMEAEDVTGAWEQNTCAREESALTEKSALTEEEKKKLDNWRKEEMRMQIAPLEKYGVSYDADNNRLLYQGRMVRWLFDGQINGGCEAIHMPEGEIDLYTVRAEDYQLSGVRVASQDEYDERTRQDELAEIQVENQVSQTAEEDGTVAYTYCTGGLEADRIQVRKETEEYASVGITRSKDGCWLWQGKPIYFLLDEDGGMTVNNTPETKNEKIYVLVKRNEDGSIREAKQITSEEVIREKMRADS